MSEELKTNLEYYKKLNAITEYELAQVKRDYQTLYDAVDATNTILTASRREVDLKTYIDALAVRGVHMMLEYQGQEISYDMMLDFMLEGCRQAWLGTEGI